MTEYFKKVLAACQALTGSRRWECIGKAVYRKEDSYVWREGRKWYRTDLPCFAMRAALASVEIGPLGLFSESYGPFNTLAAAKQN